jgi:anti-sigma B factor antagonist
LNPGYPSRAKERRTPMNLKTEKKSDVMVINVKEERLDAHNSGELKSEMQKLF